MASRDAEDRSKHQALVQEALDRLPDVRDGLTRVERVILWQLSLLEKERPGRNIPTAQLYGRVVEHVDLSVPEFTRLLSRLVKPGD